MQAIILAGGLATRLGNLTKDRPKSMIEILDKPFIEYQIKFLKEGGIRDIVICLGHLGAQIESYLGSGGRYAVDIRYSYEEELLGTAGALKKAAPLLQDTFFTIYGDSYVFLDLNELTLYFHTQPQLGLMTVYKNEGRYDSSNTAVAGKFVRRYSKQDRSADMVYIDYGLNAFRKEVLKMIPENHYYPLEELFPRLIEQQELLAYEVQERFYEVGSLNGLKEFEEYMSGMAA